jgi:cytochrome c
MIGLTWPAILLGTTRMNCRSNRRWATTALAALSSLAWSATGWCAGDPGRGATLFAACRACHSTTSGEQMTGPSLAKIWRQKAGTVLGFDRYSDAMKHTDIVWNEATLDPWLTDPERFIPGTSMTFPGLREKQSRQDVIAYLQAVSEGKSPAVAKGGGGMMSMQPAREDLKKAPPEGKVTAITHCRDTYTVKTADGKVNKAWEFNLRFKTDSSALGPAPGKPVIVGAGMQGDRASVVFAKPAEISAFVKESCP